MVRASRERDKLSKTSTVVTWVLYFNLRPGTERLKSPRLKRNFQAEYLKIIFIHEENKYLEMLGLPSM